ncbi:MAG TPA: DUF169 domain-containing protein [Candidatus Dormibacteraeota bacterium]|jgi:uncharacterized protein (DUF169 family)|nr:DUF169 domain-containing protein [Candidatus Dormibacteraeota bacterium]
MDARTAGRRMVELLGLRADPVAVSFTAAPPAGVPRVAKAGPAGCAYWKQAAAGAVFYTEAADHYNCPVGSFTHGVELPPERMPELESVVGTMVGLQYIRMEEVGALPRRAEPFRVAVYAPLAETPVPPDVVLVRGHARQIMLVAEAARAAGLANDGAAMGRPACAMIPATLRGPGGVTSLGCIGNRVYTGLGDDELYFTIPGARVGEVVERLQTVVDANGELEQYHLGRRASL